MKEENIKTGSLKAWLLAARPKTLTGAAVPVMIGLALAWDMLAGLGAGELTRRGALMGADGIVVSVLCLLFAFVMQIDANFINDYFDFMRGNDDETRLGPKRACMMGWVSARQMRRAIAITTVVAPEFAQSLIGESVLMNFITQVDMLNVNTMMRVLIGG